MAKGPRPKACRWRGGQLHGRKRFPCLNNRSTIRGLNEASIGAMTRSLTDRLAQLRTRLARLRTAHMVLGAGCACGLPAGHIDASAMDAMIGGYLADKYQAAGRDRLARLLDRARHPDGLA